MFTKKSVLVIRLSNKQFRTYTNQCRQHSVHPRRAGLGVFFGDCSERWQIFAFEPVSR
jgi:hypothetical protein